MNGSRAVAADLLDEMVENMEGVEAEVVICPPFILIPQVAQRLAVTRIKWGGQDLSAQDPGAYTGDVAADMLKDHGCDYCIVGHSERRTLYGETNQMIAQKFAKAQACGLIPILCIGETLAQRERGETEQVLSQQLDAVITQVGIEGFADAVVAYEPVWAIGTGKTASPELAQEVHHFVRKKLATKDNSVAHKLRIQYGGSVKAGNAEDLFGKPDVDGGLIGGASLQAAEFVAICRAAR